MKNLCSVLIVDDNETDRYLLRRVIEDAQITDKIFEADDGKTAIEFLKNYHEKRKEFPDRFPPPLIFLDINMPLVDGFEFLNQFSRLRDEIEQYESVVFLMVTSSGREEDKKRAFHFDFVKDYIVKGEIYSDIIGNRVSKLFAPYGKENETPAQDTLKKDASENEPQKKKRA